MCSELFLQILVGGRKPRRHSSHGLSSQSTSSSWMAKRSRPRVHFKKQKNAALFIIEKEVLEQGHDRAEHEAGH